MIVTLFDAEPVEVQHLPIIALGDICSKHSRRTNRRWASPITWGVRGGALGRDAAGNRLASAFRFWEQREQNKQLTCSLAGGWGSSERAVSNSCPTSRSQLELCLPSPSNSNVTCLGFTLVVSTPEQAGPGGGSNRSNPAGLSTRLAKSCPSAAPGFFAPPIANWAGQVQPRTLFAESPVNGKMDVLD